MSIEEKLSVSLTSFFVLSSGLLKPINDLFEFLKTVPGEYFAKLSKKYPNIYFLTTLSFTEFAIAFNFFQVMQVQREKKNFLFCNAQKSIYVSKFYYC